MFECVFSRYVKRIEKLQLQLEELMYEKDKIAYQWANAQKVSVPAREGRHLLAPQVPV